MFGLILVSHDSAMLNMTLAGAVGMGLNVLVSHDMYLLRWCDLNAVLCWLCCFVNNIFRHKM